MAQIEGSGSGKNVAVEVNIVPFIDLMSVLIIFLLITAVWQQISMIQVGSSIYGKRTQEKVAPPPQDSIVFRLDVLTSGHRVVFGTSVTHVPKKDGDYDLERLQKHLKELKKKRPKKKDVVITIGDRLKYLYLINAMDSLLESGFDQIVIATGGVR